MDNDLPPPLPTQNQSGGGKGGTLVALGCGFAVLVLGGLLLLGFLAFTKGKAGIENLMAESEAISQAEIAWVSPAEDASDEQLLPEEVGINQRSAPPSALELPKLGLTAPSATYEDPAGREMQVWFIRGDAANWVGLSAALETWRSGGSFNSRTHVNLGNRLSFKVSPPHTRGILWKLGDDIVYFETTNEDADLKAFATEFAEAKRE